MVAEPSLASAAVRPAPSLSCVTCREIQGRYRGDMGEIQGRYGGDIAQLGDQRSGGGHRLLDEAGRCREIQGDMGRPARWRWSSSA